MKVAVAWESKAACCCLQAALRQCWQKPQVFEAQEGPGNKKKYYHVQSSCLMCASMRFRGQ